MKLPNVKKPCAECPFRKDCKKNWLRLERIKEILSTDTFVCHKTVNYEKGNDDKNRLQCAGFMLLMGNESIFFQLATRMQLPLNLSGRELIFDTKEDCIKHHKKL